VFEEGAEEELNVESTSEAGGSLLFDVGFGGSLNANKDGKNKLTCVSCDAPDCRMEYDCKNAIKVSFFHKYLLICSF